MSEIYSTEENCKKTVESVFEKIYNVDEKHDRKITYWVNRGLITFCIAFGSIFSGYLYIHACTRNMELEVKQDGLLHTEKVNKNKDAIGENQRNVVAVQKDIEYIRKNLDEQKVVQGKILEEIRRLK